MLALEKCNYVSNIAYLHSAMGICDYPDWAADVTYRRALKQALMTLGSGSGFMHASHTRLGGLYDCNMMSVVAYVAYQSLISKLGTTDNILVGLSEEPQLDSREVADRIAMLPLYKEDPNTWTAEIMKLQEVYPKEYFKTIAALIMVTLSMIYPDWLA